MELREEAGTKRHSSPGGKLRATEKAGAKRDGGLGRNLGGRLGRKHDAPAA